VSELWLEVQDHASQVQDNNSARC